jgi:FO synthase
MGGTLMNENISRAAGAAHGQTMTPQRFTQLAEQIGRRAEQRTTDYRRVDSALQQ